MKLKVQLADPNHQKRTSHYEVKARARLERQIAAWKRRQSGTADDAVEDDTSSSEGAFSKETMFLLTYFTANSASPSMWHIFR